MHTHPAVLLANAANAVLHSYLCVLSDARMRVFTRLLVKSGYLLGAGSMHGEDDACRRGTVQAGTDCETKTIRFVPVLGTVPARSPTKDTKPDHILS